MKKPELAFKCFIRFLLARAAMTWGVELMAGAFRVYQFYRQGRMGRVIIMKNAAKGGGGGMTDEALYRRYLGGDEDALGALMERYGTKLTLYLDGYLCDLHEAEDLMIETFAYLIAKRPAIRDGGFRAYLYQSARHMALRLLHKKRARNCFSLDALTEEPEARELVEETVQSAERARLLRTCMAELHEDYREALFLVYFEGLSHAETAAVMGKREKQVADLIYRGKIALRKRLEQGQRRRARGILCAGTAACFVVIVSLALAMPGITEGFSDAALGGGMAASIFSGRSLGYLVVGLLAFVLGVCVTVLCVRLRGHEGDSADEERYDD